MKIGERIRTLREQRHMSQETLAEKMNVSRQAVTKWETDKSMPSTSNLMELCRIFELSLDELTANGQESGNAPPDARRDEAGAARRRLWILAAVDLLLLMVSIFAYGMERSNAIPADVIGYAQGPTNIMVTGTPAYCLVLYGVTILMTAVTIVYAILGIQKQKRSEP